MGLLIQSIEVGYSIFNSRLNKFELECSVVIDTVN